MTSEEDWKVVDTTEQMDGIPSVSVMTHSEFLDEEIEVCSIFLDDVDVYEKVNHIALIKNAPCMYRLLLKLAMRMDKPTSDEFDRIFTEIENPHKVLVQNQNRMEIESL